MRHLVHVHDKDNGFYRDSCRVDMQYKENLIAFMAKKAKKQKGSKEEREGSTPLYKKSKINGASSESSFCPDYDEMLCSPRSSRHNSQDSANSTLNSDEKGNPLTWSKSLGRLVDLAAETESSSILSKNRKNYLSLGQVKIKSR